MQQSRVSQPDDDLATTMYSTHAGLPSQSKEGGMIKRILNWQGGRDVWFFHSFKPFMFMDHAHLCHHESYEGSWRMWCLFLLSPFYRALERRTLLHHYRIHFSIIFVVNYSLSYLTPSLLFDYSYYRSAAFFPIADRAGDSGSAQATSTLWHLPQRRKSFLLNFTYTTYQWRQKWLREDLKSSLLYAPATSDISRNLTGHWPGERWWSTWGWLPLYLRLCTTSSQRTRCANGSFIMSRLTASVRLGCSSRCTEFAEVMDRCAYMIVQ